MPRYVVKLTDSADNNRPYYLEWSTVVDAPVTSGGSLEEFREYYREEYGREGMRGLDERLTRVEAKGTSDQLHDSVDDLIAYNRAGVDETCLTKEQIIDHYCRGNPRQRGTETDDETPD